MESFVLGDFKEGSTESEEVDSFLEVEPSIGELKIKVESTERKRRGSTCKQIRPLPTFVKVDSLSCDNGDTKIYFKKDELTEEELEYNRILFEETLATEFPEEDMKDKHFRDKEKDSALKVWILDVLDENEDNNNISIKKKQKNMEELEDLNFLLKSGIVLCKLILKIVPKTKIDLDTLEAGNLSAKRKNISLFLKYAADYGVPVQFLFKPDDLAVQAHLYRVTRALFAFAERTKMDPDYAGPAFEFDKILKDHISQGLKRKASIATQEIVQTSSLNSIFANLMQDVERKTSVPPKGPLPNIYSCD